MNRTTLRLSQKHTMANNVGELITIAASKWPDHPAVAEPDGHGGWRSVTFGELEQDCNRIAAGLRVSGVRPAMRLGLLVPPGIDFVALVFALFKTGAVVILVDPGIGKKNLVKCLSSAAPQGIIGIPKAQLARWIFRRRFPSATLNVVVGRRSWPGCFSVTQFREQPDCDFQPGDGSPDDPAAIIFTSGSTGPPKGVLYQHGNFICQTEQIRDYFQIEPGGADISGFPLFALFNTAMGKTTVFPDMDFTRPARVDPTKFAAAVSDWQADQSFGSPALWTTVGRWCKQTQRSLPSIKRVMSAGAPVPDHVLESVKRVISRDGEVFTPYGATEALPVACNSASEVLGETIGRTHQGAGVCVGRRFSKIRWRVIAIDESPLATLDQTVELPTGKIGELMVTGPVVTERYVTSKEANALHKVREGETVWHRMGDVGYLDEQERFWFCGRKSHRVITREGTLFTIPCESIINTHPAVYRSALVGLGPRGQQDPLVVAEPWPEHWPSTRARRDRLRGELVDLASRHDLTRPITKVLLKKALPVDIRHNAKIFREQLVPWAQKQIARRSVGT